MSSTATPPRASHTAVMLSMAATGLIAGLAVVGLQGNRMAPWILGRASGVCAYLLLWALVGLGMVMAHPLRRRRGGTKPQTVRLHIALSMFTFAFTTLHVVVLATDRWAGVGWAGALLPFNSHYRPWPVALGVLAAWLLVLAGGSASLAGRLPGRLWFPLHKESGLCFALAWLHGVFTGVDAGALKPLYIGTGVALAMLVLTRVAAAAGRERA